MKRKPNIFKEIKKNKLAVLNSILKELTEENLDGNKTAFICPLIRRNYSGLNSLVDHDKALDWLGILNYIAANSKKQEAIPIEYRNGAIDFEGVGDPDKLMADTGTGYRIKLINSIIKLHENLKKKTTS